MTNYSLYKLFRPLGNCANVSCKQLIDKTEAELREAEANISKPKTCVSHFTWRRICII